MDEVIQAFNRKGVRYVRCKRRIGRPQDLADIAFLEQRMNH